MTSEESITALIERYIDCFNRRDFAAALLCYRLPFTWLFGARAVTASTADQFLDMMTRSWAGLEKQGFGRSVILSIEVRDLGEHAALAGLAISRLSRDGSEMERLAGTYLVHHDGENWRLVAHAAHPIATLSSAAGL